jgi:long-subunit fatty acid transport protein
LKNEKTIPIIIFIVIALAAAFLLGKCSTVCPKPQAGQIVKIDTVWVVKNHPADTFIIAKPRIVFRTDTLTDTTFIDVIKDTAWTASDEVRTVKSDTVQTEFLYPEMMFKHRINYSKDSGRTITIMTERLIEKERPWWELPVSILGGVVIGYGIGRIR